jgi:hypothetical protein
MKAVKWFAIIIFLICFMGCSVVDNNNRTGLSPNIDSLTINSRILSIYSESLPSTLILSPLSNSNSMLVSWNSLNATNITSNNTSGDGNCYLQVDLSSDVNGAGISFDAIPTAPGTNLLAFTNGILVFLMNVASGQPAPIIAIEQNVYGEPSYQTAQIQLSNGNPYGYTNDGNWHTVSIPIYDFISKNTNLNLGETTAYFQLRAPNNQSLSVKIDNIYWIDEKWSLPLGKALVWTEEFNGSSINFNAWNYDTHSGAWPYNGEWEHYTSSPENSYIQNGNLVIKAISNTGGSGGYTSARLQTQNKLSFQYGRIAAKIKLPYGKGIWPAFWMLGPNPSSWPNCGEIDILEFLGDNSNKIYGTLHGPGYSGGSGIQSNYTLSSGSFPADYHIFEVEWDSSSIKWYVDGHLFHEVNPARVSPNSWVFDNSFFIIVNLAVGGSWPGYPDGTTVFPQYMYVDWIRVYQ